MRVSGGFLSMNSAGSCRRITCVLAVASWLCQQRAKIRLQCLSKQRAPRLQCSSARCSSRLCCNRLRLRSWLSHALVLPVHRRSIDLGLVDPLLLGALHLQLLVLEQALDLNILGVEVALALSIEGNHGRVKDALQELEVESSWLLYVLEHVIGQSEVAFALLARLALGSFGSELVCRGSSEVTSFPLEIQLCVLLLVRLRLSFSHRCLPFLLLFQLYLVNLLKSTGREHLLYDFYKPLYPYMFLR